MKFRVEYKNHPNGSPSGFVSRSSLAAAERTAGIFRECGYRDVTVVKAKKVAEINSKKLD